MKPPSLSSLLLTLGGAGSLVVAIVHLVAIIIGAPAYRYLGAADLAPLAESGSSLPALLTGSLVILFCVWAAYAFSAAGRIQRLPFVQAGVILIGLMYTLRGITVFPELIYLFLNRHPAPRMIVFAFISLAIGLCHLFGMYHARKLARTSRAA